MHHARQITGTFHQVVVLGGGSGDAGGVGFLESVVADQVGRHLAGQADHGNAVHQDVADRVLVEERVVDRQYRPAWVAEDNIDSLVLQRAQEDFRAGGGNFGMNLVGVCVWHGRAPITRPVHGVNPTGE